MDTTIGWEEAALRLGLSVLAGALVGLDRGEHGRPAGLRTTILVCLAAAASMVQVSLLMDTAGKATDSFVVLDLMRLPLGILSGMGFIGGGAILRRGNIVTGVTTAATLWFVTVMGLCLGGGQIALGLSLLAIGMVVLTILRWAEDRLPRDRRATLLVAIGPGGPTERQVRAELVAHGYRIVTMAVSCLATGRQTVRCLVQWKEQPLDVDTPEVVQLIAAQPGVERVDWRG